MQRDGWLCQNIKPMMIWWKCSTSLKMVHRTNSSEPCSLETDSGMWVLGTQFSTLGNTLQSSHRHESLHWEENAALCPEGKPQQWSQCVLHFTLQWTTEQNSAEICLEGSSFTSTLQEWGNTNAQLITEEREGLPLSCEKRWSVYRQGTCASSQSVISLHLNSLEPH